jgi:hypothetical protein
MGPATDEGKRKLLKEEEQAEVKAEEVNRKICSKSPPTSSSSGRPPRPSSTSGRPARALPPPLLQLVQVVPDPNAANPLGFYIALSSYA